MNLPKTLKARRESLGLTMSEAAKACGLDGGHYHRLENGKRAPNLTTLRKLMHGLVFTWEDI